MKRLDREDGKKIPYSEDISALERYYNRQFEMIKKGNTDLVTLELLMLGKALDFVHLVQKRLGVELGTGESSVTKLEEVTDALTRGVVQDNLFTDEYSIAGSMSAYLGLLMIVNIGGSWEDTENGMAVVVNGREAFVGDYVERRLLGLSGLSVKSFYDSVALAK